MYARLEQPEPKNVQDEKPTIPFQMEEVANYKMGTKYAKDVYQPRKISYPENNGQSIRAA
jgi:hypothetical protein